MQNRFPARWLAPWIAGALALGPATALATPATPRFDHAIPNLPGKSLIALEVNLAPGEANHAHHHARSAFIFAYVLSGTIRSQVEGEPPHDYHTGDSWYEPPGAHHIMSRNLSTTQPAKLLAVFVVDSDDKPLSTPDPE
ncbi:MAG TPA: cupin domain-containing protein [Kofleriaceae bacterium]|nr:cupin domain-containing protein [Kofleriaceae bacterium]